MGVQIVMDLMRPILNLGYCLTADDFYTSSIFADILLQHKTDVFGTLKLNRKNVPNHLKKKKTKKGEKMPYNRGKVCVMRCKNKKVVLIKLINT